MNRNIPTTGKVGVSYVVCIVSSMYPDSNLFTPAVLNVPIRLAMVWTVDKTARRALRLGG